MSQLAKSIAVEAKPKPYGDVLPISALLSHSGEKQKKIYLFFFYNYFILSFLFGATAEYSLKNPEVTIKDHLYKTSTSVKRDNCTRSVLSVANIPQIVNVGALHDNKL